MAISQSDRLPELEEVTASLVGYDTKSPTFDMVFAWIVTLLPAIIIGFNVLRSHSAMNLDTLITIAILQLLLITFTWRCYLGGFRWRTDRNGLTAWNIFGQRNISWHDVNEIATGSVFLGLTSHILYTKHGIFRVPANENTRLKTLGASIYQHLRQCDSNLKIEIPTETQTVWVDIPEWIPRDMTWTNPKPPNVLTLEMLHVLKTIFPIVLITSMIYLLVSYILHLDTEKIKSLAIFTNYAVGIIFLFSRLLADNGPVSVHLKPDEMIAVLPVTTPPLSAIGEMKADCKWNDIYSAEWQVDGKLLIIHPGGAVVLPHKDHESRILLLGIIRALRERENPIVLTIPDDLMAVLRQHNKQDKE